MLFGSRKQIVKRILIVEDEPLTAFDNENLLGDAGYVIVATVDDFDEAMKVLDSEQVDLILSDVRLRSQQTGIHLAQAAKERGIPTLFATGQNDPLWTVPAARAAAVHLRNGGSAVVPGAGHIGPLLEPSPETLANLIRAFWRDPAATIAAQLTGVSVDKYPGGSLPDPLRDNGH